MAAIRPLSCIRPEPSLAAQIVSGPHSAMSAEEIRRKIRENPLTYSRIVHPKYLYPEHIRNYDEVYLGAAENLEQWIREGVMLDDREEAFYLYRLEYRGHVQTGLVARVELDEIDRQNIRTHESVRENKLKDLAHHIELCRAQVGGPVLMTCEPHPELRHWIRVVSQRTPLYHFLSENGVWNTIWRISEPSEIRQIRDWGEEAGPLYIADGHHRLMAARKLCREMRQAHPDYTGEEAWNYVTCVCFGADELKILPYARLVPDRQGLTEEEILEGVRRTCDVIRLNEGKDPERRGEFVMCLEDKWYQLNLREEHRPKGLPEGLDVSVLHDLILKPVFSIAGGRRDNRLEFVGGENQRTRLEERCGAEGAVGFLLYPTHMKEILQVADAGRNMPPKSTWFTPKLCNGLFIYRLYRKKQ